MQVKAIKQGFFGAIREAGEEFEVPDGTKSASWFVPVKPEKPVKPPKPDGAELV